jgi:hypothetical protein
VTRVLWLGPLVALCLALAPGHAAAACPEGVDFCGTTNQQGTYVLYIPPFSVLSKFPGYEELAALEDCVWEVGVEFGDGSPGEVYTFDAAIGLTGSHTFPQPGTYFVEVHAREGKHAGSEEPCPDFDQTAGITYPEPPPQEEPEEPQPPDPPDPPGPQNPPTGDPADATPADPMTGLGPSPNTTTRSSFWRSCGAGVRTHRVGCRRGRRVIRRAASAIARQPASFSGRLPGRAMGFACRLRLTPSREIACRRGSRRVLAPAG